MNKIAFELQKRLVQTCIDFINEHKNDEQVNEIQLVEFNADCLQESAKYGEWHPSTDSYCGMYGAKPINNDCSTGLCEEYLIDESF